MRLMVINFAAILLTAWIISDSRAASLHFEEDKKHVTAEVGHRFAYIDFAFVNEGDTAVRVLGAEVSCTCTSYKLDRTLVSPHDRAVVSVVIDLRGQYGRKVTSSLLLKTDESGTKPYALTAIAESEAEIQIQPRILRWKIGEINQPKRALLRVRQSASAQNHFEVTDVIASKEGFQARIMPSEQVGDYWIEVRPVQTSHIAGAVVSPTSGKESRMDDVPGLYVYVTDAH